MADLSHANDWLPPGYEAKTLLSNHGLYQIYRVQHILSGNILAAEIPSEHARHFGDVMGYCQRLVDILVPLQNTSNIVQFDHARVWQGLPILFTKYVEGSSLDLCIREGMIYPDNPQAELEKILNLAIQMAHAVACLHRRRIVHADLKPNAFIYSPSGEILLSRFNLAEKLPIGADNIRIAGMTPAYCSPEQADDKPVGLQTDLWSWGLCVLEMFAGGTFWLIPSSENKFMGRAGPLFFKDYLTGALGNPAIPDMPSGLVDLLSTCFQETVADRPASMQPILEKLLEIYRNVCGYSFRGSLVDLQSTITSETSSLLHGVSLFELGCYDRATELFSLATQMFPENGWAWMNLGFSRLCQHPDRPEEALECFGHRRSYPYAGPSVGQLADHYRDISDIRLDPLRKLVWVSGDTGITMWGRPYFSAYSYRGVNLDPQQLPELNEFVQWGVGRYSDRDPWLASVKNPDLLSTYSTMSDSIQVILPEFKAVCRDCGADISIDANSDCKAARYKDWVVHLCPSCVEKRQTTSRRAIGDFQILEHIGERQGIHCFGAWHAPTCRVVILWERTQQVTQEYGNEIIGFIRRMQYLQELSHPNIMPVLGQEEIADSVIYFLPSVEGKNLDAILQREGGKLPLEKSIDCIRQVLDGLAYLHAEGFIHRELTPRNINWGKEKGCDHFVLACFNLLKNYRKTEEEIEKAGEYGGSLFFMPREQILDFRNCQPPVDLYAAGVILYHLLTGEYSLPFPSPTDQLKGKVPYKDPVRILLEDNPIPIRGRDPSIPDKLAQVIDRAVDPEINNRYLSAMEFKQALEEACRNL